MTTQTMSRTSFIWSGIPCPAMAGRTDNDGLSRATNYVVAMREASFSAMFMTLPAGLIRLLLAFSTQRGCSLFAYTQSPQIRDILDWEDFYTPGWKALHLHTMAPWCTLERVCLFVYLFGHRVGRDRGFLRPSPHHSQSVRLLPYAFTHVIITSPLPCYQQVTTLIPQEAHPDTGHSNFQRSMDLFSSDRWRHRERETACLFWGVDVTLFSLFIKPSTE